VYSYDTSYNDEIPGASSPGETKSPVLLERKKLHVRLKKEYKDRWETVKRLAEL